MIATLYANNTRDRVVRVEIPPFETGYPPIVVWGVRTFALGSAAAGDYFEVFAYVATIEVIDKDDPRREPTPGASNGHGA